ncbi:MAG TPA: hypothetical protein VN737_18730 [Bryobacteraceae bacterium]|jgi:hypothetical protein|nr:hypothetical protein [Bryobacteraceae bacterium]
MIAGQLKPEQFDGYPPEAKRLATSHIALLRQLPLGFLPLLLKELIVYDWKFPAERKELDKQFTYLASLSPAQFDREMSSFSGLRLSPELENFDWINKPGIFSEQLSAHLWATHQIDTFRAAAVGYVHKVNASERHEPLPLPRLGIVLVGRGVTASKHPLFRKLRPQGVYFKQVNADNAHKQLMELLDERAQAHPLAFGHWYIDGSTSDTQFHSGVTCVSYASLQSVRTVLVDKIEKAYESGMGSEALRTMLAEMRPEALGSKALSGDPILDRFQISLLTEGSGTQIYSTTFVQWAAREALRRAQPLTLFARFAPRQRERSMKEVLAGTLLTPGLDPEGSLIDADMGAYYTWLNQQRLSGSGESRFLVWFEDHNEVLAIGPEVARGAELDRPIVFEEILKQIA